MSSIKSYASPKQVATVTVYRSKDGSIFSTWDVEIDELDVAAHALRSAADKIAQRQKVQQKDEAE